MDRDFFPELLGFEDLWEAALRFEAQVRQHELSYADRYDASWRLVRALRPIQGGLAKRPDIWLPLIGPHRERLEIHAKTGEVREAIVWVQ